MNKADIEQRIQAAIKPQLDLADALLDHYTEGLPREVWEPIAFQAAAYHYRHVPYRFIPGGFSDFIDRINDTIRKLAQVSLHQAFQHPDQPVPPVPVGP